MSASLPHHQGRSTPRELRFRRRRCVAVTRFSTAPVVQHVALYLGDGKMLEAPYTGSDVHVSTVRTSGMTPLRHQIHPVMNQRSRPSDLVFRYRVAALRQDP